MSILQKRKYKQGTDVVVDDATRSGIAYQFDTHSVFNPSLAGFGVGTWLDYVVYEKKLSYQEALQFVVDEGGAPENLPLDSVHEAISAITGNRLMLEKFMKNASRLLLRPQTSDLRTWIRGFTGNLSITRPTLFALTGETINSLNTTYKLFYGEEAHLDNKTPAHYKSDYEYLVIPYFINHSLLASFEVYELSKAGFKAPIHLKLLQSQELLRAPCSMTGLWAASLNAPRIILFDTLTAVLANIERHFLHGDGCGISRFKLNLENSHLSSCLYPQKHYAYFVSASPDFDTCLKISSILPSLEFSDVDKFLQAKPLRNAKDYVLERFQQYLLEDKDYSSRIMDMVNSLRHQDYMLMLFIEIAEKHGFHTIAALISTILQVQPIIVAPNITVKRKPSGYVVTDKSNGTTQFSNFSLSIPKRILFNAGLNPHLQIAVSIPGRTFSVLIPEGNIQSQTLMLRAISEEFVRQLPTRVDAMQVSAAPRILKVSGAHTIYNAIIEYELRKTTTEVGIDTLGFDSTNTVWYSYTHKVDEHGIHEVENNIFPDPKYIQPSYNKPLRYTCEPARATHPRLENLAIAYAYNMIRAFYKLPCLPIKLSATSYKTIQYILHRFGYTKAVPRQRGSLQSYITQYLNNYPMVFAADYSLPLAEVAHFKFVDAGDDVDISDIDYDTAVHFSEFFETLVLKVVHTLLSKQQEAYLKKTLYQVRHPKVYQDAILDGKMVLSAIQCFRIQTLNETIFQEMILAYHSNKKPKSEIFNFSRLPKKSREKDFETEACLKFYGIKASTLNHRRFIIRKASFRNVMNSMV